MVELADSGGGSVSDYESFGDKVNVEVTDLVSYWEEMTRLSPEFAGAANTAMGQMPMMITQALNSPDATAGAFPEGAQAARMLNARLGELQQFVADVTEGVRNVGSAAAVVAELYENSDNENGATLDDIGFVFSDPRATPPSGFRNVESWSEYQMRMAEETGQNAMSATGAEPTSVVHPFTGYSIYFYSDGSSKEVTTTTLPGASHGQGSIQQTVTRVMGADGQPISTVTTQSYQTHVGDRVNTTTTQRGDDSNGSTSTTRTTEDASGDMTVTNTSQTTTNGEQSDPVTNTTTVDRTQHQDTGAEMPVGGAEERVDSHGRQDTVEGFGY